MAGLQLLATMPAQQSESICHDASSRLCTVAGSTCQTDILSGAQREEQSPAVQERSIVLMKPVVLTDFFILEPLTIIVFGCFW